MLFRNGKNICNKNFKINYDNKIFTNSENGETVFYYHQNGEIIWAE
jgi:outer membrane protein assembly factor BamB